MVKTNLTGINFEIGSAYKIKVPKDTKYYTDYIKIPSLAGVESDPNYTLFRFSKYGEIVSKKIIRGIKFFDINPEDTNFITIYIRKAQYGEINKIDSKTNESIMWSWGASKMPMIEFFFERDEEW